MQRLTLCFILCAIGAIRLCAQENSTRDLTVYGQSLKDHHRLLPADTELKSGNAVVVMLRMIWEQQRFMEVCIPKLPELMELPYDDPKIATEFPFDSFYSQLRRAALMRDAEWNYPLGEEPMANILLPDMQGLRNFIGRGLALWIGRRIAEDDFGGAIEGLQTQFACSRHLARTPFLVNQLVALACVDEAFIRLEILLEQPESPNLYEALAMLPDSLGDYQAMLQWQGAMMPGSLPSLQAAGQQPSMEDAEAWKQIAEEFSQFMLGIVEPMSHTEGMALKLRMLAEARRYLIEEQGFTEERLSELAGEAIVMRWLLALNEHQYRQVEAAYALPAPQAIKRLLEIEAEILAIEERVKAPASPMPHRPATTYISLNRFDRRVKQLQCVEAIRDYIAIKNELPTSLDQLRLAAPRDPLTDQPFEYRVEGKEGILRTPAIPGISAENQYQREYRITISNKT